MSASHMKGSEQPLGKCSLKVIDEFNRCKIKCGTGPSRHQCLEKCERNLEEACYEKVNPLHDCHRWCEREYGKWYQSLGQFRCKADCDKRYNSYSPEVTLDDIKNASEDIGNSSYTLADSVSVL